MMRTTVRTLIVAAAVVACSPAKAEAPDLNGGLRASCTANGRVVYREDLPANASFEKRRQIMDAFPEAMCIFLSTATQPTAAANNYGFGNEENADDSLVAALAAISGGRVGEQYPNEISKMFSGNKGVTAILGQGDLQPATSKSKQVMPPNFVNLTLGVYKNVKMSDILAHWKIMQKSGPTLKKLTPTFDVVDDVTVMSIMQVPDGLADKVCTEASEKGQGCVAFF